MAAKARKVRPNTFEGYESAIRFYAHDGRRYSFSVSTSGIGLWDYTNQRYIWQK